MKAGVGIAIGLLLAFLAHFLAFGMAGAGHGWITPFWASFLLWIVLPLTFATVSPLGPYRYGRKRHLLLLVAVGLVADASLLWATIREGTEYFLKVMDLATGFPVLWLAIWSSWQLLALISLTNGEDQPEEVI